MIAAPSTPRVTGLDAVRDHLRRHDSDFWVALADTMRGTPDFTDILTLANLRKKAERAGIAAGLRQPLRLALLGGSNLYPLQELVEQFIGALPGESWWKTDLFVGEFDNYTSEMLEAGRDLDRFRPEVIVLIPSGARCRYEGSLTDEGPKQKNAATAHVQQLLGLCRAAHQRTGAEIILTNYLLPAEIDPGPYRTRSMGSSWSFRKMVNLELGFEAPSFVHLCDVEFLGCRRGLASCVDARRWFESKQIYSPEFAVDVAREVAHIVGSLRRPPRKVLALDLDDTLWGGVIGDDGLAGIEIGTTTPRGEAFRAFQESILALSKRGVLLAVCTKNDPATALEPFDRHPEMVLRRADIASFQADWEPKTEGLRRIAEELNLGLDSIVFVDDNPAEIEIVQQFLPEVETILLGPDPADYVSQLLNARIFEPQSITTDDLSRSRNYQRQALRTELLATAADMTSYLQSLEMRCDLGRFSPLDTPRIAQLINKSNQFNLTARRRSEAEVCAVAMDAAAITLSARLSDRFGDNGLVSVVIAQVDGAIATIDTWLMSCRVLKRDLEFEVLRELAGQAQRRGCDRLVGVYRETARNALVRDLYLRLGFSRTGEAAGEVRFELRLAEFVPHRTSIQVVRTEI